MSDPGTITIGQVGLDVPLWCPEGGQWSGDRLSIGGSTGGGESDELDPSTQVRDRVLRTQLTDLATRTGEVHECTFAGTPELDGWYLLDKLVVSTDGASFAHGMFNWDADITRVPDSARVVMETRLLGRGRPNEHGLTTARRGWWSPGCDAYAVDDTQRGSINAVTTHTRVGEDGPMVVRIDNTDRSLFDAVGSWRVAPGDAHRGAVRVGWSPENDGRYYRVIANQMPHAPHGWTLANSLVAATGSTRRNRAEFAVRWHTGDRWGAAKRFRITYADISLGGDEFTEFGMGPLQVIAIRNRYERGTIRIYFGSLNAADVYWLDLSLRRGSRTLEAQWSTMTNFKDWGVKLVDPDPDGYTPHTSGIHATAPDDDGFKVILNSPTDIDEDTTAGAIRADGFAATSWRFGISAEPPAASTPDQFTGLTYQYHGDINETVRQVTG